VRGEKSPQSLKEHQVSQRKNTTFVILCELRVFVVKSILFSLTPTLSLQGEGEEKIQTA
jgi:hypothetical protein